MKKVFFNILLLTSSLVAACQTKFDEAGRWVKMAREANQLADQALGDGQRDQAVAALRRVWDEKVPQSVNPADGRIVRQDACFRLALLDLESGDPQSARNWADRGLSLGRNQDLFTANLLVARGRALDEMDLGPEAAEDFHQALLINEALLKQVIPDTNGRNGN